MKNKGRAKTNHAMCSVFPHWLTCVIWRLVSSVTETVWAQRKPWSADVWTVHLRQCGHGRQWIHRYGQSRLDEGLKNVPNHIKKMRWKHPTWKDDIIKYLVSHSHGFCLSFSCNSGANSRDRGILFTAFHSWQSDLASITVKDLCVLVWICRCEECCQQMLHWYHISFMAFQINHVYVFVADVTIGAFMADSVVLLRWVTGSFSVRLHSFFLPLESF